MLKRLLNIFKPKKSYPLKEWVQPDRFRASPIPIEVEVGLNGYLNHPITIAKFTGVQPFKNAKVKGRPNKLSVMKFRQKQYNKILKHRKAVTATLVEKLNDKMAKNKAK
jgi:hypothetical protein